jgi:hypothetical protein
MKTYWRSGDLGLRNGRLRWLTGICEKSKICALGYWTNLGSAAKETI